MTDETRDLTKFVASTGAIAAVVSSLTFYGFKVASPSDQLKEHTLLQGTVVQQIERQLSDQNKRIDSLGVVLDRVNALVQVKCIETSNKLIRQMLECPR